MPFWRKIPTEGEYASHSGVQGGSRTFITDSTLLDPSNLGPQTSQAFQPYNGYPQHPPTNVMAIEPNSRLLHASEQHNMLLAQPHHRLLHYSQTQATSFATNVWGGSGVSPYAVNSLSDNTTLDPSLLGNKIWVSNQSLDYYQKLLQASSLSNQYNGSSFRETNVPAQGTNTLAEDNINPSDHPFNVSTHYVPPSTTNEVEGANTNPKRGKRRHQDSAFHRHHQEALDQGASHSADKKRCSTRRSSAAPVPPPGTRGTLSVLGLKKAKFGDTMGDDNKPKAEIKRENEVLYGWVDNDWRPAGYHRDFREKLILLDAQQSGAPVFRKGMSTNYTSYSPMIRDWTEDPHSIKDSKGRELMYMAARPQDLTHNPTCGYLMCEGLVMLDHNNRPIKAYPGAPRTLAVDSVEPRAFLIEGLRRALGMTFWDVRARMAGEYDTPTGIKPLQTPSVFTNRVINWRKLNQLGRTEDFLGVWHKRRTPKATKPKGVNPSKVSNEGQRTPSPPQHTDEVGVNGDSSGYSPQTIPTLPLDDLRLETIEWDDFED